MSAERVEFEGELQTNIPARDDTFSNVPSRVRVVTEDGRVTQITFHDRDRRPSYEVLNFVSTSVTRYRVYSKTGKLKEDHDLTRNPKLSAVERARVDALAEVLLRHFKNKGGYRRVSSN
jgi:diketogulonate reductase-like aldo/keto reductase